MGGEEGRWESEQAIQTLQRQDVVGIKVAKTWRFKMELPYHFFSSLYFEQTSVHSSQLVRFSVLLLPSTL